MVTKSQLKKMFPNAVDALVNAIVSDWPYAVSKGIDRPARIRQFFANIGVETGHLRAIVENMNYTTAESIYKTFNGDPRNPRFKTVADCQPYVRQPEKLAIKVYGGRMGNKPAPARDGWIYRGGGMMQTTGLEGYRNLGYDKNPAVLQTDPKAAFRSAVDEWFKRGCNQMADGTQTTNIRKAINGGTNGLSEVKANLSRANSVWPNDTSTPKPELTKKDIEYVQTRLRDLGYSEVGTPDGKQGTMTNSAVLSFRADHGLPLTVAIDTTLLSALSTAKPRAIDPERKKADGAQVRDQVPEVKANFITKIITSITGVISMFAAFIYEAMSNLGEAKTYLEPVKDFFAAVPTPVWFIGMAVGAFAITIISRHGEKKGVEAFQKGERR